MQASSQSESEKSSSPIISRWLCPWLPTDHNIDRVHEVQLRYQRQIVRLICAAFVFGCSAIFLPDGCQASSSFIPTSKALSLAGLLAQFIFYHAIPSHIPKALSFVRIEETRSRAVVFFASLWVPFVPFVLSVILLCLGAYDRLGACIPIVWHPEARNLQSP